MRHFLGIYIELKHLLEKKYMWYADCIERDIRVNKNWFLWQNVLNVNSCGEWYRIEMGGRCSLGKNMALRCWDSIYEIVGKKEQFTPGELVCFWGDIKTSLQMTVIWCCSFIVQNLSSDVAVGVQVPLNPSCFFATGVLCIDNYFKFFFAVT